MDSLTTTVFQELFATPKERDHADPSVPEISIEDGVPRGQPAVKIAHEAIIAQGFSKIKMSDRKICYSRLNADGGIEYRSLEFDPGEKKITPESITDKTIEDPFPSKVVEGFPIGIQP